MALTFTSTGAQNDTGRLERSASVLNHNAPYTFMYWVRRTGFAGNYSHTHHIGGAFSYDGNTDAFGTLNSTPARRMSCAGGASNQFLDNGTVPLDVWTHYAIVRTSATNLLVYENGAVVAALTITADVTARAAASLMILGNYNSLSFNGKLACVKAWAFALDAAAIADEIGSQAPVTASPWGFWPMDDAATVAANLPDESGNARDWSLVGTGVGVDADYPTFTAPAAVVQEAVRFRADDGSETGAAWLAAQNVNVYRAADLATRIRFLLQASADPATAQFQLEYRLSGGSWAAVPLAAAPAGSVTWGAIGTAASGTTTAAAAYPTGISAATSKLYCLATGRSNTANTAPTMPAGWTKVADYEDGTGTWGVDTGTRRVALFRKDTVTGSESGTVTVSLAGTTANTLRATIFRVEVPTGHGIEEAFATAVDNTRATSFSLAGATSLSWAANDLLVYGIATDIDTATHSSVSITASGVTFGTRTNRASTAVTNGNDHRSLLESVPVTAGSGSSAPTYAATLSVAGSGVGVFMRLRSVPPVQTIRLAASANIAAAAATATTAQLSGGTGTFLAGRISDDTNPLPTLDIGADGFTEIEWCVDANGAGVTDGQVYEFRVTAAGVALDGYTVAPTLTIGPEPGFSWPALVRRPPALFRRH